MKKSVGTIKSEKKLKYFPSAKTVVMLKENELLMLITTGLGKSTRSSFVKQIHNHNFSTELSETFSVGIKAPLSFYL